MKKINWIVLALNAIFFLLNLWLGVNGHIQSLFFAGVSLISFIFLLAVTVCNSKVTQANRVTAADIEALADRFDAALNSQARKLQMMRRVQE